MAEGQDYPVNIVFDAIDRVTASARRINSRIEKLTGPFRRLNNRMRALDRASGFMRLRESIGNVGRATGRIIGQFGRLATRLTLIGGIGAAALGRIVNGVAKTGDEFAKLGRSLGISSQFLQEYFFVAERVGVSQGTLTQSFIAFSKRLGEMRGGYGMLRSQLEKSNPQLMQQLETAQSTEEAFGLLMGAMEKMEDPAKRSALAAAAFSRQGVRLTNIAAAGSDEVNRLRRRAHELGLVMSDESLKASEEYQDSLTNMKSAMSGLRNIIGASLIPVIADLMDRMTIFFVNNRDEIRDWAEGFAATIPDRLRAIRDGAVELFDSLQPLIGVIQWMFDTFGTGETIIGAVALVLGGPLLASIAALIPALTSLGVVIATTPVGWFLAGVAGIAAGIWGMSKAVEWVGDKWPEAWQKVSDVVGVVIDAFMSLADIFSGDFGGLQERLSRMAGAVERLVPDWLKDWLGSDDDKTITVRDETGRNADRSPQQQDGEQRRSTRRQDEEAGLSRVATAVERISSPEWMRRLQSSDAEGPALGRDEASSGARATVEGARGAIQSTTHTERRESRLSVDFRNLPRGTRVEQDGDANEDIDLGMGFAMGMP